MLHWATAAVVIAAIPLGLKLHGMQLSLSTLWLFGLHKTLGISALALILVRLLWHRASPVPPLRSGAPGWQDRAALIVHRSFYVVLVVQPLSGWVASSATGIDTVVFGRWTLPAIASASPVWEAAAFAVHRVLGYLLIGLIVLHVAGALHRTAVLRDGTLWRIIRG